MDDIDQKIKVMWDKLKAEKLITDTGNCPDDRQLLRYVEGILTGPENDSIEQHLLSCDGCLNSVIVYEKLKKELPDAVPEIPTAWIEKVVSMLPGKDVAEDIFDIVLKFAKETIEIIKNPGSLTISRGPILVAVRGISGTASADYVTVSKIFPDIRTEVEVERAKSNRLNIKVLITPEGSGIYPQNLRVSIYNPFQEIASSIAENGEADFTEMKFGKYIIKLLKRGEKIGQVSLDLKQ